MKELSNTRIKTSASGLAGEKPVEGYAPTGWYVVNTQPRAEIRAKHHLELQRFCVFCPRYRKTVRHARKTVSAFAPLFPNYLFVGLDLSRDQWRSVNGTRGVVRILMQDGVPQAVPDGVVADLQAKTRADGTFDWTSTFKIGGTVRIAEGPFADLLGTLEYLDAAGRVRVLLELLGRSVSVGLRSEALLPAV